MNRIGLSKFGFLRMTLAACVGIPLIIASNAFAQNPPPSLTGAAAPPAARARASRGLHPDHRLRRAPASPPQAPARE